MIYIYIYSLERPSDLCHEGKSLREKQIKPKNKKAGDGE
jgi:hypothetical protein